MSHFLRSKCSIRSRAGLVAALEELGFHPTVHDIPTHLRDYHGDVRPETAGVIVPRAQLWGASNDVGFSEGDDGTWSAIVSEYDRSRGIRNPRAALSEGRGPMGFAVDDWLRRVTQLSGVHSDLAVAAELGLVAERVDLEDGTIDVFVYQNEGT